MIEKLNDNAVRYQIGLGNILTLNRNMSKVSMTISGPRGGQQQVIRLNGDTLLEMLDAVGGVSSSMASNYVDIVLDGCCRVCESSINAGEQLCCDCLNEAIARHKAKCPAFYHEEIVAA